MIRFSLFSDVPGLQGAMRSIISILLLIVVGGVSAEHAVALDDSNPAEAKRVAKSDKESDAQAFATAIKSGDLARVKTLVEKGVDVNSDIGGKSDVDPDMGVTPLIGALFKSNTDIAKYLIEHGANVNARAALISGEMTATPLSLASQSGLPDVVKLLLEKGADLNYCVTHPGYEQSNGTPLILALKNGHFDIAKMLVAAGADINAPGCMYGGEGTPAIYFSVGDPELTELLLSKGADPNLRLEHGWTPLMSAVRSGKPESAKLLLKAGADVNATAGDGRTALMEVLYIERAVAPSSDETCFDALNKPDDVQAELVSILIDHGADPAIKDRKGNDFASLAELFNRTTLLGRLKSQKASEFTVVRPAMTWFFPAERPYGGRLAGDYLFLAEAGKNSQLEVINLKNPQHPVQVSSTALPQKGLDVAIDGNIAYVAVDQLGLQIFDISILNIPKKLSEIRFPDFIPYVEIVGKLAFVLIETEDEYASIKIVNVADPAHPKLVGEYTDKSDSARRFFVQGKYVYLAQRKSGLRIIDVSQPAKPVLKSSLRFETPVVDVVVLRNLAYVGLSGDGNNVVLDVSDPADPKVIKGVDFNQRVSTHGNTAFVKACQLVVDMIDPVRPKVVGVLSNRPYSGHRYAIQGDTLVELFKNQVWKFQEPVVRNTAPSEPN